MTKGDLIQIVFGENAKHVDVAVNSIWAEKVRELGVNPEFFVWSYIDNNINGKPVNLLEKYALLIIEETEKIPSGS